MKLVDLVLEYDLLQKKYGAPELDAIYNGGCIENADLFFVFMNPTARNIASNKEWLGRKSPWIGTKNIWSLFYQLGLLDENVYLEIRSKVPSDWNYEFADLVYSNVEKHKYFITNLGKCNQLDARVLPDIVFEEYLQLLYKEIEIVNPKAIITFGNQVSSIVLEEKISVSKCRKQKFVKKINGKDCTFYPVYYPIGNGYFNIDKAIEDLKYIINSIKDLDEVENEFC